VQFLQQGVTADEWNDFGKYLLEPVDNISAINVLYWWRNDKSVYPVMAAIASNYNG